MTKENTPPNNSAPKKAVTIGFRGTEEYREQLQAEALARGIKVQGMLRLAIDLYLAVTPSQKGALPVIPGATVRVVGGRLVVSRDAEQPVKDPFADISKEDRARIGLYVASLRAKKKTKAVEVPDELAKAVTGLVKWFSIPKEKIELRYQGVREMAIGMLEEWSGGNG